TGIENTGKTIGSFEGENEFSNLNMYKEMQGMPKTHSNPKANALTAKQLTSKSTYKSFDFVSSTHPNNLWHIATDKSLPYFTFGNGHIVLFDEDSFYPYTPSNELSSELFLTVTIHWFPIKDNKGNEAVEYIVKKNGEEIGRTEGTSFTDNQAIPGE